jgi:WD40 repeat protein
MKRPVFLICVLLVSAVIIFSGCVSEYEVTEPPKTTPPPEETSTATVTPTATPTIDPIQILSGPTWTWSSSVRIKDVSISDDGNYVGGVSTQKAVIKTPTKNLLTNLVWSRAQFISVSGSGEYIGIADEKFVKLYDNTGGELYSYNTGGTINQIRVMDNGNLIQGGEKPPQLSAVNIRGNEVWNWEPGISTAKVLVFDYSADGRNLLVGTQDDRVYYLETESKHMYTWFKDVSGEVEDIKISDDGEKLYVLTDDNKVHSFDKYANKNWEKQIDINTVEIEISKDGNYILTKPYNAADSYSFKNNVYLLDQNGNVKWMKTMGSDVGVIGISEDAEYVVISEEKDLRMYNLDGDDLATYHLGGEYGMFFVCLDMTPDASKLALGTTNSLLVFG